MINSNQDKENKRKRRNELRKINYHKDIEASRAKNKAYREKHHDTVIAYQRKYYKENTESIKTSIRKYQADHREEINAYSNAWNKKKRGLNYIKVPTGKFIAGNVPTYKRVPKLFIKYTNNFIIFETDKTLRPEGIGSSLYQ